jgi:hypothetical protein
MILLMMSKLKFRRRVSITHFLSISLSSLHSHAMSSLAINAWKNACRVFNIITVLKMHEREKLAWKSTC